MKSRQFPRAPYSHAVCWAIVTQLNERPSYLIESPHGIASVSNSNKYPKHILCEEIRTNKLFLTHHSAAFQDSLQRQSHFNPATSLGTNAIVLGPVVQSVVSLTSSLRVISLTVLADSIYNILIFFADKM